MQKLRIKFFENVIIWYRVVKCLFGAAGVPVVMLVVGSQETARSRVKLATDSGHSVLLVGAKTTG